MVAIAANHALSVRAAELLATQKKKFSIDLPAGVHQQLKMIAAANNTTVRDLILDGLVHYVFPKYIPQVPDIKET